MNVFLFSEGRKTSTVVSAPHLDTGADGEGRKSSSVVSALPYLDTGEGRKTSTVVPAPSYLDTGEGRKTSVAPSEEGRKTSSVVSPPPNLESCEALLYNKMYDRFTLQFNNMQIIVAKVGIHKIFYGLTY